LLLLGGLGLGGLGVGGLGLFEGLLYEYVFSYLTYLFIINDRTTIFK
jgi:hypothetical protein